MGFCPNSTVLIYAETEKTAELMDNVSKLYEELISFSDLYDSASFEAKKMIVNAVFGLRQLLLLLLIHIYPQNNYPT